MERQIQLVAVKYIDEIVCYATEQDPEDLLLTLLINVRVLESNTKIKTLQVKLYVKTETSIGV